MHAVLAICFFSNYTDSVQCSRTAQGLRLLFLRYVSAKEEVTMEDIVITIRQMTSIEETTMTLFSVNLQHHRLDSESMITATHHTQIAIHNHLTCIRLEGNFVDVLG